MTEEAGSPSPDEFAARELQALPPAERCGRIAAADLRRDTDEAGAAAAHAVYCALAADLDPADARDAERIRWLAASCLPPAEGLEALMLRAAETASDAPTRARAHLVAGRFALERQAPQETRYLIREALRASRGTCTPAEGAACLAYGQLSLSEGQVFEAFVLVQRARSLLGAAGNRWERADADVTLCSVLRVLGRFDACVVASKHAEERIAGLPSSAALALEHRLLIESAAAAAATERADDAWDLCALLEQRRGATAAQPRMACWFAGFRANVRLTQQRYADALELVQRARSATDEPGAMELFLDVVELRATALAGAGADVSSRAPGVLDRLAQQGAARPAAAQTQVQTALDLAETFDGCCDDPELARRALDIAATAAARRIVALDHALQGLRQEGFVDAEDLRLLTGLRDELVAEQRTLVGSAAALLERSVWSGARAWSWLLDRRGLLRLCPWCVRVQIPEVGWTPLSRYLGAASTVDLTHCMCHDCFDARTDSTPAPAG